MNTAATRQLTVPQPLLSTTQHIALVVIVSCVLALVLIGARSASQDAMRTAKVTYKQGPMSIMLAPVQIVGRRDASAAKKI